MIDTNQSGDRSLRILLVDDDEDIIEPTCALLEMAGYQVVCAGSGEQAVDIIKSNDPIIDLVVLDMLLPGMDGRQALKTIRGIQPDLPVILASGGSVSKQMEEMKGLGCNAIVQKPYKISDLRAKIEEVIDAGRQA